MKVINVMNVTFLDAVATVDVLRASNNVANLSKLKLYISSSRFERINKLTRD